MIWFTSDLHFGHDKPFIYEPRGFKNVHDMNAAIVSNWNAIVQPDDDVYVLGDLMLNDNEAGLKLIHQLKGNIHIILGNHDTDSRVELYSSCYNVCSIEYATVLKYNGYRFYLSHYPTIATNYDQDKPLKRQTINLCGHTHAVDALSDITKGLIYHCELDAHDCRPICIDDIIGNLKHHFKLQ